VRDPVDQLLFGYRDGHELIAGSRELSPTQLRDVLPHIDASIERAEERQLVGTWVPSLDGYLLARIWPAPERLRRGAAWGHALVLRNEQLRSRGLTGLPGLLRRPESERFDSYLAPLAWPSPVDLGAAELPLSRALVWAALDEKNRPGVVLWDDPRAGERTLVALLDALPPAARAQLSFRTRREARPGSYRVVLAATMGVRPDDRDFVVIDARRSLLSAPPSWTNLLDQGDAAERQRAFIERFGARDASTCAQVLALAVIAELLDAHAQPDRVIDTLVEGFPAPNQVGELRAALLGVADRHGGLWRLGEPERLTLLLERPAHFDVVALSVSERLAALVQRDPHGVLALVERVRARGRGGPRALDE
jgi:hypothetical protein